MTDNTNFNDAIKLLDEISKSSFLVDVWIPSINRYVKIQEITAKQQKCLMESAIDSEALKFNFNKVLNEILCENCQESSDVTNEFTIMDKNCIILSLRNQISNKVKIDLDEDNKTVEVDLEGIVSKFKDYIHPENKIISYSKSDINIELTIACPTIQNEYKFDNYIYGNLNLQKDELDDIKNLIGAAFLGETSKYIKGISINGNSIDYNSLHVPQKIQFVEKLPANLVQKLVDTIVVWKEDLQNVSKIVEGNISKSIDINSFLFLSN